jgi:8-oxo-dGTP diphosphatase
MKTRVRSVIMENNALLLIHRIMQGREYYVFPGGGVEEGETEQAALAREALEELGVSVEVGEQFAECKLGPSGSEDQKEVFYRCRITGGTLGTGQGPEFQTGTHYEGMYLLEWIPYDELPGKDILPEQVKRKLIAEVAP